MSGSMPQGCRNARGHRKNLLKAEGAAAAGSGAAGVVVDAAEEGAVAAEVAAADRVQADRQSRSRCGQKCSWPSRKLPRINRRN